MTSQTPPHTLTDDGDKRSHCAYCLPDAPDTDHEHCA